MNFLKHLAIIMDGNRRWAKKRGFLVTKGHEIGVNTIDKVAEFCIENGVKFLTLYAFSTENWKRPKNEIDFLMKIFKTFLDQKQHMFIENEIKFTTIGDISCFDDEIKFKIKNLKNLTKDYDKLSLNLAINYGSQDEIVRACEKISKNGEKFSIQSINSHLDTAQFGDVDLLIRTGGEHRISNFLLWQISYAELYFSDTLWPDFEKDELKAIFDDFKKRERRLGI